MLHFRQPFITRTINPARYFVETQELDFGLTIPMLEKVLVVQVTAEQTITSTAHWNQIGPHRAFALKSPTNQINGNERDLSYEAGTPTARVLTRYLDLNTTEIALNAPPRAQPTPEQKRRLAQVTRIMRLVDPAFTAVVLPQLKHWLVSPNRSSDEAQRLLRGYPHRHRLLAELSQQGLS